MGGWGGEGGNFQPVFFINCNRAGFRRINARARNHMGRRQHGHAVMGNPIAVIKPVSHVEPVDHLLIPAPHRHPACLDARAPSSPDASRPARICGRNENASATHHSDAPLAGLFHWRAAERACADDEKFVTGETATHCCARGPFPWRCRAAKATSRLSPPQSSTRPATTLFCTPTALSGLAGFAVAQSHKCGHNQNKDTRPSHPKSLGFRNILLRPIGNRQSHYDINNVITKQRTVVTRAYFNFGSILRQASVILNG